MKSEAKCKTFHMKISFVCIWITNFHNKNFALSLAFMMRLKATRKWSIDPPPRYGAPFVNLLFRPNSCCFSIIYKKLEMMETLFTNKE